MDTAAAALPQRPPRARRADRDAAEAAAAAAEAMPVLVRTRSAEKRPREADDDDLPCSCGGGADAAEPPEGEMVPVSWTDTNDALQHFEYMDHTADIQLHAWGPTVEAAFGWTALCMFNYMTPLRSFESEALDVTHDFHAEGHDMQSLLFAFLDELLFVFSTEMLVVREMELGRIDREHWEIKATGRGSRFIPGTHEQGTEVKAITYSAMQIHERETSAEVFVIVDI